MKRLIIICAILAVALIGTAQAVVIDFESLADLEIVDNQFLALGADFNASASVLSLSSGSLVPSFPPYSGDKLIYDDPSLGSGTIRIDAIGQLWVMAGGYVTGNTDITLTAYDSGGNVLGTDHTGGANYIDSGTGLLPNIFLSVNASSIAYVQFTDSGNTFTVDDFTFSAIPAPGAILLGSIGVGLVGWLRRRKTL